MVGVSRIYHKGPFLIAAPRLPEMNGAIAVPLECGVRRDRLEEA